MRRIAAVLIVLGSALARSASALADDANEHGGEVRLPLAAYQQLLSTRAGDLKSAVRTPAYAFGQAKLSVAVRSSALGVGATIHLEVEVGTAAEEGVLVPLLPLGTAVAAATADEQSIRLISTADGLVFEPEAAGEHRLAIDYQVEGRRTMAGASLGVPVPPALSTEVSVTIPGRDADVSIVPAIGQKTTNEHDATSVVATVAATRALEISWRLAEQSSSGISRAIYRGKLEGSAVAWTADLEADVSSASTLAFLPAVATLSEVVVDGKKALALVDGGHFATRFAARGHHQIHLQFEVPAESNEGRPHVDLALEPIPITRFELTLPGKKEVSATPSSNVRSRFAGNETVAIVNAPLTSTLSFSWSDAVPEEKKEEVSANATFHHVIHAEEGILQGSASIAYEVTRGETNLLTLDAPAEIQINRITAAGGEIAEWRADGPRSRASHRQRVSVFLDRKIRGQLAFEVQYERPIGTQTDAPDILSVPLLHAENVRRQRGMVALLTSSEYSLKPVEEHAISRVGENQLPASIRQALTLTIAHTYKYVDPEARLAVQLVPPEQREAKFDAQVDTLISFSDVTMKGSATARINVKSGKLSVVQLVLPSDVTLLNLTAPSKRTHSTRSEGGKQIVDVYFTQEMDGEFPIDIDYERLLAPQKDAEALVAAAAVSGAEPEQGRIGVEALTAVEVQQASTENLSSIDVGELPQQLLLKTRNPIRLAYKYMQAFKLGLKITRHTELETQEATIESARYRSLFTRDGLMVTAASFVARNTRKQFLKMCLPAKTEVWSVFVDGKSVKPALEAKSEEKQPACATESVLIKIISSPQGFPIELVYKTMIDRIGSLGTVRASLPRPDVVVTSATWSVFLPDHLTYRAPDTNMEIVSGGNRATREEIGAEIGGGAESRDKEVLRPIKIALPASAVQYAFEKLYANQTDDATSIAIAYASVGGEGFAGALSVMGALILCAGLVALIRRHPLVSLEIAGGIAAFGVLTVVAAWHYLGVGAVPPLTTLAVCGALALGWKNIVALKAARAQRRGRSSAPASTDAS